MPKKSISPLILEGIYEYTLRFSINKSAKKTHSECADFNVFGNIIYFKKAYSKKEYTLEDVKKIRNEKIKFYEDAGLRRKKCMSAWNSERILTTNFKQISQ
jgi:hypothetical protein